MITIIDYGMGNLRSVQKGFEKVGYTAQVTDDPRVVEKAERLVLPGVGAFRDCMDNLRDGGFIEPIHQFIATGRPFLGICLGFQVLLGESEEFGSHQGLGIFPGKVTRFAEDMQLDGETLKVPHMGWNRIQHRDIPLFKGVAQDSFVYFVHSYYVQPEDSTVVAATTDYGIEFCSAICRDNVMATQFHPEKSQQVGLTMLKNFGEL
ncbi:imidazole glycerol phosphate synthase subunit HisH [Desulfuromonas acetoxidans]|uniref:Imidazole glycerol phosphate synthase subunit HisH n=1 Tax=Desulfuromonas acetoxidans (strain DSM 684 / 11070) TaxID=281689 RepID=Q1K277_DESA6|nr:imidazole glycerol phosphate synthase subunit HisH [Desulfuromonas acetoxidans]EAT16562.1 imidazole glycerol phosphate synthase, glutamine amidotransferase subunit [Desulfuromonas acetoxidans DSM 684]MBF0644473.1 imidazole glycerol phosphate synthase subunit HisH [Desulfuromonas acetoxidans]NVD24673.1 imidazole glycerol phosphate synthase subunit HisH [Desulfuromonas acetoxidans]NVE16718.1 imidazole glycerol phosphate synthase subunit HisH [Desulfuromonas acetoxidans]